MTLIVELFQSIIELVTRLWLSLIQCLQFQVKNRQSNVSFSVHLVTMQQPGLKIFAFHSRWNSHMLYLIFKGKGHSKKLTFCLRL